MAEPAPHQTHDLPIDSKAFYKHTSLEELTTGYQPLTQDDLDSWVIEDLTEEESRAFWEALESWAIEQVVVDTGVLSAPLDRFRMPLMSLYARHLVGRIPVAATQTIAEMRFGALVANWGERRMGRLSSLISSVIVAPIDDDLTWVHARLRLDCRKAGHPLANDVHAADLWIAATAVRYNVPLVSHDGIFRNVPGLQLITELGE